MNALFSVVQHQIHFIGLIYFFIHECSYVSAHTIELIMLTPSCTKDVLLSHYGWNTGKQTYHMGKFYPANSTGHTN
jgi:hypothetical protein